METQLPPELAREQFASEEEWKAAVQEWQAKQPPTISPSPVQQVMRRRAAAEGQPEALVQNVDALIEQQGAASEEAAAPSRPVPKPQPVAGKAPLEEGQKFPGRYAIRPEGKELVKSPEVLDKEEAATTAPKEAPPMVEMPSSPQTQAAEVQLKRLEDEMMSLAAPSMQDPKEAYDKAMGNASAQARQDIAKAIALRDNMKNDLEKRELTESIINAIGLIVSGMYGQAKGIDMGGVKLAKTDWEKKYDRANDELRTNIIAAEKNLDVTEKDAVRQAGFAKDANERARQLWDVGYREKQLKLQQERVRIEGVKAEARAKSEEEKARKAVAIAQSRNDKDTAQKERQRLTLVNNINRSVKDLGMAYSAKGDKEARIDSAVNNLRALNDEYFNMTGKYMYNPNTLETKESEGFMGFFKSEERPSPTSIKRADGVSPGAASTEAAPAAAAAPALGPNEELRKTKDGRKIVYDMSTNPPTAVREIK